MGRKRTHTPEETVAKLRQVEVLTAQGKTVSEAVRDNAFQLSAPLLMGITTQVLAHDQWCKLHGSRTRPSGVDVSGYTFQHGLIRVPRRDEGTPLDRHQSVNV